MPQTKDTNNLIPVHQNSFQGGATVSKKLGIANSYYYSQSLDNRSEPSQLSVLPGPATISNSLGDLITAMDQDLNGVRWGVGANGGVFSINTSDVISKRAQLPENGSAGILYNHVTDQLYIPGQTAVSMYGRLTVSDPADPVFRPNQFAQSASQANGTVNLYNPASGFFDGTVGVRNNAASIGGIGITKDTQVTTYATKTYSLPLVLSENYPNYCFFAPDIEPFYSIDVYIVAPGTGNWTLTLHDSLNNILAAVMVTHANLKANSYNQFKFASPIRALINAAATGNSATYHFHLTSTVADGTAGTINASDLTSCDFLLYAYRLVPTRNGWHPMTTFTGTGYASLYIGNGPYLSAYNFGNDNNPSNTMWQRSYMTFDYGEEVCSITVNGTYLLIGTEIRSKDSSRNYQSGAIYVWDGSTQGPSQRVPVPMGSPYSMYTFNGVTYFTCAGSLFAYTPGAASIIKVRKLAYQNTDYLGAVDSTIVNPNMAAVRYNVLMMGFPSSTTNFNLNYGVWSWGTVELTFPNSYGLSYTLANGIMNNDTNGVTNLQIGCIYNFVDSMYISWSYTKGAQTYYGVDLLDNFSTSSPTFAFQTLIYDGGVSYKVKFAARCRLTFLALPSGCTLELGYSLDRGSWQYPVSASTADVGMTLDVNQRFHEIQFGFQGTTTGVTTPPIITGITWDVDALEDESQMTKAQ
jgi:hypothetical protein